MQDLELIREQDAIRFANDWIEAWNLHNLDAIMAHYADDARFTSPFVTRLLGKLDGALEGTDALRAYFAEALRGFPYLRFELQSVLAGVDSIVITYRSVAGLLAAEYMEVNDSGRITWAVAHYSAISNQPSAIS